MILLCIHFLKDGRKITFLMYKSMIHKHILLFSGISTAPIQNRLVAAAAHGSHMAAMVDKAAPLLSIAISLTLSRGYSQTGKMEAGFTLVYFFSHVFCKRM